MDVRVVAASVLAALLLAGGAGATVPSPPPLVARYADPTWSPNGKRIAFVSDRDNVLDYSQIYVANADGTGVARITNDPTGKAGPTWSPDGTEIAFQAYAYLDAVRPDGSGRRRIALDHCCGAEWSPTGKRIAYAWSNETSGGKIFVIDRDGGKPTLVAAPRGIYSFANPTWSPNGQKLAFNASSAPDTGPVTPFVGVVSRYRGRVVKVSSGRQLGCLDWSPNGRILLVCDLGKPNSGTFDPWVAKLDLRTHRLTRLVRGYQARWSPSGRRIVFAAPSGHAIDVMNADGSGVRQILP